MGFNNGAKIAARSYAYDFLAILAGILWATIGIWGKLAFAYGMHPLPLATLRALIASGLFFVIVLIRSRINIGTCKIRHVLLLLALGFTGVTVNYGAYLYAIRFLPVALATLLLYTYPLITVIISRIFLKEPVTATKMFALCLAMCGTILVLDVLSPLKVARLYGIVAGFTTAIAVSVYNVLSKIAVRTMPVDVVMFFSFLFGGMLLGIFTSIIAPQTWQTVSMAWQLWAVILALTLLPTVGGYFAFVLAVKNIGAGRASILATLEPVVAALLAYLVFGESLKTVQIFGTGLVVTSVILLSSKNKVVR